MKLFRKTFVYMLGLFAVMIVLIHVAVYIFLPRFYLNQIKSEADKKMDAIADIVSGLRADSIPDVLESYAKTNKLSILAEVDGKRFSFENGMIQLDAFFEGNGKIVLEEVEQAESVLVRQRSVRSSDGRDGKLQLVVSTSPVREAKAATLSLLPFTAALALLVSLVFSYFYAKRIRLWETIEKLEEEKRHIAKMEKQKVDFLRAASHELKTPLATLRILLENMQYNVGKYKNHEIYLPQGIEQVDHLTKMVREIMEMSKFQSRDEKEPVSVEEAIIRIVEEYRHQTEEKRLSVSFLPEGQTTIEINRAAFERVLQNLIGNAVRHSADGGEIRITTGDGRLCIENTCEPLPKEQLNHIFEAFYRPDFARNRKDGGSGLGLYIVKEILDVWKLPYWFEACEDGMCFTLDFASVKINS